LLYAVEKLAANAQNLTRSGSSACNVGWHKTCHIPHARCCHAASCIRYADSQQTAQARSSTVCSTRQLVIIVGRSYKWVAKDRDAARACAQRTRNGRWLNFVVMARRCCRTFREHLYLEGRHRRGGAGRQGIPVTSPQWTSQTTARSLE